jgi:hypothetical protein
MISEERPLLTSTSNGTAHESIYDRFTPAQKKWIVFVVSFAGLLPGKLYARIHSRHDTDTRRRLAFVQMTFVPSIPQIAKDLDSTHAAVRCVVESRE